MFVFQSQNIEVQYFAMIFQMFDTLLKENKNMFLQ